MKNLLIFCIFGAAIYFGYRHITGAGAIDVTQYDLSKVEERPIPKDVFFQLWKNVALQKCADAEKNHNLTPDQCRQKIEERHSNCARSAVTSAPQLIAEKAVAKQLGKQYLDCATPYFFCKGVEVRTEEEARQYCQ